nr:hypothetical protein [Candidatus Nitrosacidococcus sp. I8]
MVIYNWDMKPSNRHGNYDPNTSADPLAELNSYKVRLVSGQPLLTYIMAQYLLYMISYYLKKEKAIRR